MTYKTLIAAMAAPLFLANMAFAQDIEVTGAHARTSFTGAPAGAAFMTIRNTGDMDDLLIEARSDVAARIELHTHIDAGDGVMQMREVEGGIVIPAGGEALLQRGGDHVMFMGITEPWDSGDTFALTLVFESGEEVTIYPEIRVGDE